MPDTPNFQPAKSHDEAIRRVRDYLATHPRQDPSDTGPAETRRIYWQLREVSARMRLQIATSRRQRAEEESRLGQLKPPAAREEGPRDTSPLGRIQEQLRESNERLTRLEDACKTLATKVEVEALKGEITIIADGFGATRARLDATDERLDRIEGAWPGANGA